jgi:alpha-L-fucosidase
MKPTLLALVLLFFTPAGLLRAGETDPGSAPEASREWFRDAKFGLFIHWGVYSLLGDGEWVMNNRKIPIAEYEKLPPQFNPTEFDPAEWVGIAKRAGQKYITITSKHHDGFCMWGTKETRYNIVDGTPYGKDVLLMLSEECKRQGIKLFFYHSHLDWHHPDYFPRGGTGKASGRPESGNWSRYIDHLNRQLAELCSPPYQTAGIWFDGWWDRPDADWQLARTYGTIHRLRPEALIGNNHHVAPFPGEDFQMFEQDLPGKNTAGFNKAGVSRLPLESCRTINNSWGYNKGDHGFRPLPQQIRYLVEAVGHDSNLLLNVGPTPQGKIPPEAAEILLGMGKWLEKNGEAVYGTRPGPWEPSRLGYAVHKGSRAYFHLLAWPKGGKLSLKLPGPVTRVSRLDGDPVNYQVDREDLLIQLPESAQDPIDTILAIDAGRDLSGVELAGPSSRLKLEGEKTLLGASQAQATGKIRLEGEPKNALGFWSETKDHVSWAVEAAAAGRYDVSLTYACEPGSEGSDFEISCGDSRAHGKIYPTADWGDFLTVAVGEIEVPAGSSQIGVRALAKPGGAPGVMNLRQLTLERGFVPIFNGKDLEGWQGSAKGDTLKGYRVEDGALVCLPEGSGNIYTRKEYADFTYRLEFRLTPGANNGVGIRAPLEGDAAYVGMEIQVLDDRHPMYKDLQPWQAHGSIYNVVAAKRDHLRKVGEWNVEEITARGRQITVILNGVTIVDANLDDVKDEHTLAKHPGLARKKGYLGFLGHGSRVEFRNLRVKEIPEATAAR